jgi:hypothetical protein
MYNLYYGIMTVFSACVCSAVQLEWWMVFRFESTSSGDPQGISGLQIVAAHKQRAAR